MEPLISSEEATLEIVDDFPSLRVQFFPYIRKQVFKNDPNTWYIPLYEKIFIDNFDQVYGYMEQEFPLNFMRMIQLMDRITFHCSGPYNCYKYDIDLKKLGNITNRVSSGMAYLDANN